MTNGRALPALEQGIGKEVGVSGWVHVTQDIIDRFAECTGDRQWIHVDVERASRESPHGGTIAHGYLTLSLVGPLSVEAGISGPGSAMTLNYGLDRVRFIAPVRAGARVRNRVVLLGVEDKGGGRSVLRLQNTMEIEGEAKPALIAESLAMVIEGAA